MDAKLPETLHVDAFQMRYADIADIELDQLHALSIAVGWPHRAEDWQFLREIGSGFVATDINRALAELDENLQVETDTLSGNRTRTKLGYKLTRDLQFKVGYAPGQTTYREPDTTFAFLDWQFIPKWSLLATQGNRGTSILDVLFQHRY